MDTFVQLDCPACEKAWERDPNELPEPDTSFTCPDCDERAPLSEFARTQRDLEVIEEL